jgi:hypothetical protein
MIRVIDRFWYRFALWCRERREEYFSGMRFFWKRLAVTVVLLALGFAIGIAMGAYYTEPRHLASDRAPVICARSSAQWTSGSEHKL